MAAGGTTGDDAEPDRKRRAPPPRVWLHDVEVEVIALRAELADIEKTPVAATQPGTVHGVRDLLNRAEHAATGVHPHHRPLLSWWTGDCVEAAFRNVHRAEAEIAKLYGDAQADAAFPNALSRLQATLGPRALETVEATTNEKKPGPEKSLALSRAIQIGHEVKDQQYSKVRRFRNIVALTTGLIALFLLIFATVVSLAPRTVPLCFTPQGGAPSCPAGLPTSGGDVWVVVLLGLLGGSLAAAVSIRNIRGTPTPYNLATALAILKVPSGGLTAVGAIVLLAGRAVPGFSGPLESQGQILAYALIFGYAQQLLTGLIDRRAVEISTGIQDKSTDKPAKAG